MHCELDFLMLIFLIPVAFCKSGINGGKYSNNMNNLYTLMMHCRALKILQNGAGVKKQVGTAAEHFGCRSNGNAVVIAFVPRVIVSNKTSIMTIFKCSGMVHNRIERIDSMISRRNFTFENCVFIAFDWPSILWFCDNII